MNDVQIIKTRGEDLVVLSRRDYDALLARAGDEAAEEAMSLRILAKTKAQTALPADVMDRIIDGENPVAVLLEHRKLTQANLALLTGLSQSFISKIARGKVGGRRDTIEVLCKAFGVSAEVLVN